MASVHAAGQPAMSALLKMTPLSGSTQDHLAAVYLTLCTTVAAAAAGAVTQLYTGLAGAGVFSVLGVAATLFYFLRLPPRSPRRLAALHAFGFAQGFATGPLIGLVMSEVTPVLPAVAFAATATIFAGFTVSAMFARRRSYLFLGSLLGSATSAMLWVGLLNMWFRSAAGYNIQLYGGLMVFSAFVLYDTQLIIEKAERGAKDHVQHAFDLFVDFIAIFRRVLIIMARNAASRRAEEDRRRRRK